MGGHLPTPKNRRSSDVRLTARHRIAKLVARTRSRGVHEVVASLVTSLRTLLWSTMEITFWSRSGGSQAPVRNDVTWRPATAEDASDYARDIGTDSPTTFTARLRSGQACYLVVEGPRLLHATWASSEPVWMAETRRFVAPPRDDVYLFESFTRSEARGRGLFSFAVESITAASPGRKLWIAALDTNVASIRAIQRAGFAPAFRVRALRRLGFLRLGLPAEATAFFGGSAEGTGGP